MSGKYRTTSTKAQNVWLQPRMARLTKINGGAGRKTVVNEVLLHLVEEKTIAGWRTSLSRKFRLDSEADDVEQIICTGIAEFLSTVSEDRVERIDGHYIQHLWNVANLSVKTYQESGAHTGLSGFTGVTRRQKLISRGRAELTKKLERTPTDGEVKEYINAQMLVARKNATKQGVLLKDSDFGAGVMLSTDHQVSGDDDSFTVSETIADAATESRFLAIEADEAMRALVSHMRYAHPGSALAVQCTIAWAVCVLSGVEPTAQLVGEEVGCAPREAQDCINLLLAELPVFSDGFQAAEV